MKNFDEFIFENSANQDIRDQYKNLIEKILKEAGILDIHIQFDIQGYMIVNFPIDTIGRKYWSENIDKLENLINLIKILTKISVKTIEKTNPHRQTPFMHFTFDFRELGKVDPYFKSLLGLNKYNL